MAAVYAELGDLESARRFAREALPLVREAGLHGGLMRLAPFVEELGVGDDLRAAVALGTGRAVPVWRRAIELAKYWLDKTGLMSSVAGLILRRGGTTEARIVPIVSGTVGFISSFMQNVGAAALFLRQSSSAWVAPRGASPAGIRCELWESVVGSRRK